MLPALRLILPIPRLAFAEPFERRLEAAFARLLALRFGHPLDVFVAVARAERVPRLPRFRVPLQRFARTSGTCSCRCLAARFHGRFRRSSRRRLSARPPSARSRSTSRSSGRSAMTVMRPNCPIPSASSPLPSSASADACQKPNEQCCLMRGHPAHDALCSRSAAYSTSSSRSRRGSRRARSCADASGSAARMAPPSRCKRRSVDPLSRSEASRRAA